MSRFAPLPVDPIIPNIVAALHDHNCLLLEAPPGAGKTTRVPPALLEFGEVWVLEPRRIAARMAARRVAYERGETVGHTVGYQVRFEDVAGTDTRLRFMTEGVLTRRLLSDPEARSASVVVLDEFHERHLDADAGLALLRRLQQRRPDLRLIAMSATLDGARLAAFLGGCPVFRSEGRLFDLRVEHSPYSAAPLEEQVEGALRRLVDDGLDGHVLIFLPGAAEIRRAMRACAPLLERHGFLGLPLHGDLSVEEQDRAVQPSERKVIFSTNVAESSITIDGVTAVIDSGLARIARDSAATGLPSLEIGRISKSSCIQRSGRAGRTRPGRVIRLYSAEDFARRPDHEQPEICRRDLSGLCLELKSMGMAHPSELEWLDPPPEPAVAAAELLLDRLGAADRHGSLTRLGRRMARLPLHPRLAAMILEADSRGVGEVGCAAAAVLSAGERLPQEAPAGHGPSDVLLLIERERSPATRRLESQIRRLAGPGTRGVDDAALQIALLRAFPDRVARRRSGSEFLLAGGGCAVLSPSSTVQTADWLVAADIEERRDRGLPLIRLASAIRPEWLLDLFPDRVETRESLEWNKSSERVESVSALLYENLVVEESRHGAPNAPEAGQMLAARALEAGLGRFVDPREIDSAMARLTFAAEHAGLPPPDPSRLHKALASLCHGLHSFDDLRKAASGGALIRCLRQAYSSAELDRLDVAAPERIRLPGGRSLRIHYEKDKPPWAASRLQDFFGLTQTPRLAGGKAPLVLHLLAPNQRPVQTTTDLAGFWQRLYPQLRRELSRRYPKHRWPEDPLTPSTR